MARLFYFSSLAVVLTAFILPGLDMARASEPGVSATVASQARQASPSEAARPDDLDGGRSGRLPALDERDDPDDTDPLDDYGDDGPSAVEESPRGTPDRSAVRPAGDTETRAIQTRSAPRRASADRTQRRQPDASRHANRFTDRQRPAAEDGPDATARRSAVERRHKARVQTRTPISPPEESEDTRFPSVTSPGSATRPSRVLGEFTQAEFDSDKDYSLIDMDLDDATCLVVQVAGRERRDIIEAWQAYRVRRLQRSQEWDALLKAFEQHEQEFSRLLADNTALADRVLFLLRVFTARIAANIRGAQYIRILEREQQQILSLIQTVYTLSSPEAQATIRQFLEMLNNPEALQEIFIEVKPEPFNSVSAWVLPQ